MNKRQLLLAAALAAVNAGRQNAIAPATQAFGAIKDDALPEAARPAIIAARTTLNGLTAASLTELPGDSAAAIVTALDAVVAEEVEARLADRVQVALNGKLTDGSVVAKADHEAAVKAAADAALKQGADAALAGVKVTNERRERVTQCGLTVANEAVLAGTDDEFNTRLTTAQARQGEKSKLTLNGKPLADHLDVFAPAAVWEPSFASAKTSFETATAALKGLPTGAGGGSGGDVKPKFG